VARYGKEHKEATRQRIVATAGRRFKADGIDGTGIAALMAGAGLTNGAFYAHFDSKDDLVAAAVTDQLREQRATFAGYSPDRAGVERLVRDYLSPEHRDGAADGCPSAALLDEIGRHPGATRQAYTDGLLPLLDDIVARLGPADPKAARLRALSVFALLVGTLQVARAMADPELADAVLDEGIANALTLLDG
jgi:TetR/AcrR family transcriptional repressor of nem operon